MKKALLAMFSSILILIFVLIFFTLYGRAVRQTEINNALEHSMRQAIAQLQFDEGIPESQEIWTNHFVTSITKQIHSHSDLSIHIYEADMEKGILSAEAILYFPNFTGTESSVSTGKRTIILEEFYDSTLASAPLALFHLPANSKEELIIADTNADSLIDGEEAASHIHSTEQAVLDAGYGVVVPIDTTAYSVLTHGSGFVNGKSGDVILRDYLKELGLEAGSISGCWIDSTKDCYRYIAENIHKIDTNGLEWTDTGSITFVE